MGSHHLGLAVLAVSLVAANDAAAEPWLTAEVPAAVAVSERHSEAFRGGALPAIGVYGSVAPRVALAMRVRAGVLGDASAVMDPSSGLAAPGWGGLGTLSFAVRTTASRLWLEGAAGGGITGTDVVPAVEVGAGFMSRVGAVEVGPSLRYLHVRAGDGPGLGSADLVLIGFELRKARTTRIRPPVTPRVARREPPAVVVVRDRDRLVDAAASCADDPSACATASRDRDTIVDVSETCSVLTEALGGDAEDGCTAGGPVEVTSDRIILAEHVLFAVNRARVRRAGIPVMGAIATTWRREGWLRIVVEGHADVRGDAEYNLWLSRLRAERARDALIDAGIPADAIEAVGRGATQPRSADHDLNRRVEFVIVPQPAVAAEQP